MPPIARSRSPPGRLRWRGNWLTSAARGCAQATSVSSKRGCASTDATRIAAASQTRIGARDAAMVRLRALLGLAADAPALRLTPGEPRASGCGDLAQLLKTALASRPDVRAAELQVEAAGERVGLEKGRVMTLTAILDANGEGRQGFEMGPRPRCRTAPASRRTRAAAPAPPAELERAGRRYLATRASVSASVEAAYASVTSRQQHAGRSSAPAPRRSRAMREQAAEVATTPARSRC